MSERSYEAHYHQDDARNGGPAWENVNYESMMAILSNFYGSAADDVVTSMDLGVVAQTPYVEFRKTQEAA